MSMNSFQGWTFDARTVDPLVTLDPVPDGWYKVIVAKTNIKPTRDPANYMLELQCQIVEGQFQGRILYWNLNLFHSTSQAAVEISRKTLSAISHVTGQFQLAAQGAADHVLPMLHNIPFYIQAIVSKGEQGPINNIKGCRDIHGNEPGKATGAPIAQQPAPPMQSSYGAPPGFQPQPAPQPQPGAWQSGPVPQQPAPGTWTPPQQPAAPLQPAQPYGAPQAAPAPTQAWQPGGQPVPGTPPGTPPAGMPPQGATPWGR